jgi:ATP-dependent Lhr-like helicase
VDVTPRDLPLPSMLALEVLAARPYAFLDDAPLEERRTQAVVGRRWLDAQTAADLGRLDPAAIERVRREAWPQPESADEMYEALALLGYITAEETERNVGWATLLRELADKSRAAQLALPDVTQTPGSDRVPRAWLWIAAERWPEWQAVMGNVESDPVLQPPRDTIIRDREAALVEIVRGRLEGVGPTTAAQMATQMHVSEAHVGGALLALEAEGFAMRGQFTGMSEATEWCDRRLLARINRYTVKRLRDEIEPVSAADFMRFLLGWQHLRHGERMDGPDAVAALVSQLEGYEAAAGAWEAEILPARMHSYDPAWLDDLCLSGRVLWTRLEAPRANAERERGVSAVRGTPITLLTRKNLSVWSALVRSAGPDDLGLSSRARRVADYLREHGASFFDDIVQGLDLPRTFVEEALSELVGVGLVNSGGFSGLRALLLPSDRRKQFSGGGRRRSAMLGVEDAGRWALIRRREPATDLALSRESVEQIARTLLRRYGVVFWRVLAREAEWLPPWRDLLLACRRLEARGEIRGGRFVAGFSGEQFALPEAVGALRAARRDEASDHDCVICGADPLNLAGILTPGMKVPGLHGNRLLLRNGVPAAAWIAGEAHYFEPMSPEQAWQARNLMLRASGVAAAQSQASPDTARSPK